ncbi:Uncharacterized protein Fot_32473 [Forsythia ovata]|uniref:Transposase n=1 Tax=Forsythia ovata TaxID=205694 RepID=A0ABD1T852_9LAMI
MSKNENIKKHWTDKDAQSSSPKKINQPQPYEAQFYTEDVLEQVEEIIKSAEKSKHSDTIERVMVACDLVAVVVDECLGIGRGSGKPWYCGKSFRLQSFLQFKFQQENNEALDDEIEGAGGAGHLPRNPDGVPTRGACKQIKTSRIVRTTREKIRVLYNSVSRRATSSRVHSLLVHDIGAIIRSHCPMNMCYWRSISPSEKKDLMDEITTNFEISSKDSRLANYINRLYNGRYREFKAELSAYYKLRKSHEDALANPPLEMLDRGVDQWVELCNHFNSDKFKASSANIENRSKKKYNHRTGSRPLSYIVEEMAVGTVTRTEVLPDGSHRPFGAFLVLKRLLKELIPINKHLQGLRGAIVIGLYPDASSLRGLISSPEIQVSTKKVSFYLKVD